MQKTIAKIGKDYLGFMAGNFPVMCSNDEFHILPRVEEALLYTTRLDSLNKGRIKKALSYIQNLLKKLESLKYTDHDLDAEIDIKLLKQSMSTFLREFGHVKIWQIDPGLYIKIYLLAIDQLVSKVSLPEPECIEALVSRIKAGNKLLEEARANLKQIPQAYKTTALDLVDASGDYLANDLTAFLEKHMSKKVSSELIGKVASWLSGFKALLKQTPASEGLPKEDATLEDLLRTNYSYKGRGPEEIFNIAAYDYSCTIEEMKRISSGLSGSKNWKGMLSGYYPKAKSKNAVLKLYSGQISKLKDFLIKKDVITIPKSQDVLVSRTPRYMVPIRQTASYASPLTRANRERAFFYVTVCMSRAGHEVLKSLSSIHNEYIFVTAHETYPGHHLLDSKRRMLKNRIRRSIESPLFYEGWASYAERIIDALGYVKDPRQRLVGLKRQAWRAVRAMLDVGVDIKRFTPNEAAKELGKLGYHPRIVKPMLKHYALTRGYQLCYALGKFEFDRLRERFMPRLGMKRFHDLLLASGEIPFDLLEKKMERELW